MENTKETHDRFSRVIEQLLPNKIIGFDDLIGIYNIIPVYKGGTDEESKVSRISREKFTLERAGEENFMRFSFVAYHLKHLMGEVLTVVEASMPAGKQLEAIKSIIKKDFNAKISWIYENCGMPEEEQEYLVYGNSEE